MMMMMKKKKKTRLKNACPRLNMLLLGEAPLLLKLCVAQCTRLEAKKAS